MTAAAIKPADPAAIDAAAALIQAGEIVSFPTETVYGLGANALDDTAVAKIFAAKRRPSFNPLIAHVPDTAAARALAVFDDRAASLADALWPGAVTMVLKQHPGNGLSKLACAGLDTVALRCPAHAVAQDLLAAAGMPIVAPSANRSGTISPTTAAHVAADLGEAVGLILDAGPCAIGLESTIVDLTERPARILRPGGVANDAIAAVIGDVTTETTREIRAPGQLERHYAPSRPLRMDAAEVRTDEALLAFGPAPLPGATVTANLSPTGDLTEAAANLFAMLHDLDHPGHAGIAVMAVPETGLGIAINDRLRRAAARAKSDRIEPTGSI